MSRSRDPGDSRELSRSRPSVMSASLSGSRSAVKGMTFPGCRWPCTRIRSRTKTHPCSSEPRLLDGGLCRRPVSANRILYWLANVFRRSLPFDQSCLHFGPDLQPGGPNGSQAGRSILGAAGRPRRARLRVSQGRRHGARAPLASTCLSRVGVAKVSTTKIAAHHAHRMAPLPADGCGRGQRTSRHDVKAMSECPTRRSANALLGSAGKSANQCRVPYAKIFWCSFNPNHFYIYRHPASQEGRIAIVTDVGCGMQWTQAAPKTKALGSRTVKSCGPDAPTLASSW
jgi:hypothetical protein